MKIYKYWVSEMETLTIEGRPKSITCFGGSNVSLADARENARKKSEDIQRKISGSKKEFENYEAVIREELLQTINPNSLVTRNRYGARVLNVADLMIMDIDHPRPRFMDLFRFGKPPANKARIVDMVKKLGARPKYQQLGFRIYETCKGVRVIVVGKMFNPRDPATRQMMAEFHCDSTYALLCHRQNCYRARLTAKPSRMKVSAFKVRYPRTDREESEFRQWVEEYEKEVPQYSVCKLVEQTGRGSVLLDAIKFHDEVTGAFKDKKLA